MENKSGLYKNIISGMALILYAMFPVNILAQDKPIKDLYAVRTPNYCLKPSGLVLGKVPDNERAANKNDGTWVVFADRDDDTVYVDKNLTKVKTKVDFLESFYVIEETENAVRLISFQQKDIRLKVKDKVKFNPEEAMEVGWMPKNKLLLWQTSLTDSQTGFLRKAVPVWKLVAGQSDSKVAADRLRKGKGVCDFYKSPYFAEYDPTRDVNFFKYLFIFKEENNRLLIGTINEVSVGNVGIYIKGWVPKNQVHVWNNAVCLRINYEEKAVRERLRKGIDVRFFQTSDEAERFGKGDFSIKSGASIEFAKDGQGQYESSYILGFPIISDDLSNKGVYKTGYITNVKGPDGRNIFTVQDKAKIDSIVALLKSNIDNVNILFVLDGALRQSYFDDIASVIDNNVEIGNREFSTTNYSWGAVIYNDVSCGGQMIQKINWENKKANFVGALRRQAVVNPPGCRFDRKNGAPVLSALKEAARMFTSNRTNNIIILVGTSGDTDSELTVSSLVKSFVSKTISLRAFQVDNIGGAVYEDFFDQCRELMVTSAEEIDRNLSRHSSSYASTQNVETKLRDNSIMLTNTSNPGEFTYCAAGVKISKDKIRNLLGNFLSRSQDRLEKLKTIFDDGRFKDSDYTVDQQKSVLAALVGVKAFTEDEIAVLSRLDNIQLFIESYTVLRTDPNKLSEPLLVRSLFMSSEEFNNLRDIVGRMESATSEGSREVLRNAILRIQLMYIGGNLKNSNLTIGEIMHMAGGVPSNNRALRYKPDDILNSKKVPESCINQLREGFRRMKADLDMVERDDKGVYKNDKYYEDEVFYWIPEKFVKLDEDCGVQKDIGRGNMK